MRPRVLSIDRAAQGYGWVGGVSTLGAPCRARPGGICYPAGVKLLLTIVQDADAARLEQALRERNFQSTKMASTGGFLREGNTTLIIGVEDKDVALVQEIIHANCRERTKVVTAGSPLHAVEGAFSTQPMEVPVGGAIVFVLSVEAFHRL